MNRAFLPACENLYQRLLAGVPDGARGWDSIAQQTAAVSSACLAGGS